MVAALPALIPTDLISFNEVNPLTGRYRTVVAPDGADRFPGSEEIFERHVREHPYVTKVRRFEDGRAHTLSEFVSAAAFRRSTIYNEYYRRIGTEHQLAIALPGAAPWIRGVALSRRRPDYSTAERRLLTTLGPHLVQAYRNAETLELARRSPADGTPTNGDRPEGGGTAAEVVLVSSTGRVHFATARARRWFATYLGSSTARDGRLPSRLADRVRSWATQPLEPFRVARDGGGLEIRLAGPGQQALLVRERRGTPAASALVGLGLSGREAEVLAWVVDGKTNGEVAAILGTRPRTVAKHLERIFRKLGVETRTAGTAAVLGRPPG